jgi:predicted exporter
MRRAALAGSITWALFVLLAAGIAARATYTADLSAFLPRRASPTQRLLVEQLREGPAAHLIIVAIEGGDAAARAQLSAQLATRLRSDPAFAAVDNGDAAQLERDRTFLFEHRYLLSAAVTPQRFTTSGLHAAISDSLAALASPEGPMLKALFARDPTGELPGIIDSLDTAQSPHTSAGVWSSADGTRALLLVQTRAPGLDTDAQQAACRAIERAFTLALAALPAAARPGLGMVMSGPPVFAVASRAVIKREVLRLSSISALLIAALLLAVYRSLPALALTLVPVATGALAGVAAVALGFGAVHGLALGFGVTLIGEAVDYSIYLFIQASADFRRSVWPTIRSGMLTSICGFAALLPSAFPGLAQLGLYSIAGLVAAALVTRFVLPAWLPQVSAIRDLTPLGESLLRLLGALRRVRTAVLLLPLAALVLLLAHRGSLWSRELAALSPIPAAVRSLDDRLHEDAGVPNTRYFVVASAAEREGALAAAQAVRERLAPLLEAGVIGAVVSPSDYLPPLATQRARRASLPSASELRSRLEPALAGLPVSAARLQPFVADVEQARAAPLLTRASLAGTSFAGAVDALLVRSPAAGVSDPRQAAGWSALLPVSGVHPGELPAGTGQQLRAALAPDAATHAVLLDLQGEADRLYAGYLTEALELALVGLVAIVLLLLITLRSALRVALVVAPLLLAVITVAGLLTASHHQLTILHVVGMLLIAAVGSNYGLFFDRSSEPSAPGSVPLMLASLLVANLATVTAFGVLACSSVPVLRDLGSTVAPGALLALLFAALLARPALWAGNRS